VKRERAVDLLKRLRDRFAPNGLLHFGQGKWYPGESLPRWAFGCYWRRDREPIWRNPSLIAEENGNDGFTAADARRFITTLAAGLDVDPKYAVEGFEDAFYYLWRECRLPSNVDPHDSKLDNPEDRARLMHVFEQGLKSVVGYALPLRRSYAGNPRWESGSWFLRGERMYLIPGDSPMGYRLPLDSMPWEVEGERQFQEPLDPFAERSLLRQVLPMVQSPAGRERERPVEHSPRSLTLPARRDSASIVRTALCVEPRGGTVHVFMPPVRFLEDYLDLVAAIETAAAQLEMPVRIEGYKPPSDHRINSLNVTPDPGVVEVNVHPAHSWEEAVENTEAVYEDARLSRLAAEKFMLDGRHTGTGGGNHVVLGGPTAADSPFLRRPDLLRSLVGFWVNHPSLSYLFSGMFVGPTSQHPRVDEARHDALRELEIAFSQVPPAGAPTPPAWLVDRLFRHLLVDATGNTHRTEFCIDKLYNPDTAEGRRGLVELRSFEMPPDARMSCAQQLLLRALVSWFWRKPYERELVRWGTAIHDRFMLPHFVADDLNDVLSELRDQGGYAFDLAWFAPHVEFRFPTYGTVSNRGVDLELRAAIEPWHVLGEEVAGSGTARYVDSSVERVQVKVRGLTDPRHIVTCNGRRVPLHPTGTNGEFVAGVRYRAWQPPSCLHPTIGVHSPLVFDVLDTWNDRSIGGCIYHVAHPGGRAHETFPVNAREAEGRRLARFFAFGHTPGSVTVPPVERNRDFPFTLDLRQAEPELPSAPNVERPTVRRSAAVVS
jgi:uncharacterized protein (DUF2126 family)